MEEARAACEGAEAVLIAAGAGIGVDSGLPDFRGNEGFWRAYPPYRHLGFSFMEMASPARFAEAPDLAWGFYGHRLELYRKTQPHEGYVRLLEYAQSRPAGYFVFTSNVDGQFQTAGVLEDRMMECHGSIRHLQCFENCQGRVWSADALTVAVDAKTMRAKEPLPRCSACGGQARPNILMFGDWGWNGSRTEAQQARFRDWLRGLSGRAAATVVLEFGAGTAVPTVRRLSERFAEETSGCLVRINPREAQVPTNGKNVSLEMTAREAVERLLGRCRE